MGVNVVHLLGNLGDAPEVKYTQGGVAVAKFSLATSHTRKNKEGEKVTETQWHRVTAFGKLAEICGEYLEKGSKVYASGMIRYSKYTDRDGVERYSTEIAIDSMEMLDGKKSEGEPRRSAPAKQTVPPTKAEAFDDFKDDDIPF